MRHLLLLLLVVSGAFALDNRAPLVRSPTTGSPTEMPAGDTMRVAPRYGLDAAKGAAASYSKQIYIATDTSKIYWSDGATWAEVATSETAFADNEFEIYNAADNLKTFIMTLANQTSGTQFTLNTGSQAASRQLNIPTLSGTDTVATLGVQNTFTEQVVADSVRVNTANPSPTASVGVLDQPSSGASRFISYGPDGTTPGEIQLTLAASDGNPIMAAQFTSTFTSWPADSKFIINNTTAASASNGALRVGDGSGIATQTYIGGGKVYSGDDIQTEDEFISIDSNNTSAAADHIRLERGTGGGNDATIRTTGDASNGVASVSLRVQAADLLTLSTSGATFTVPGIFPTATTSIPSIRMPHGTAPSSPTNGDMWSTTSGVYARVNGATVGPFIDASGGGAIAYFWAKPANASTVSITSATTATINRVHVVSGTSADYDITISGLSPQVGDVLGFQVAANAAASKQYRLDAGGTVKIAGRTRYLTLVHSNIVLLRWDGTDWGPLVLDLDSPWVSAGTITITAVTSNPTKGTTSYDRVFWRRVGDSAQWRYEYRQTVAGAAGSGDYLIGVPFGTIDTAKVTAETGASGFSTLATGGLGNGQIEYGGTGNTLTVSCYDSTRLRFGLGVAGMLGSGLAPFTNASHRWHVHVQAPMTDW